MKFTDGNEVWECNDSGDWIEWVQNMYEYSCVMEDYIDNGIEESYGPVKIGNLEYSVVTVLDAVDQPFLSQIIDGEIEYTADSIKECMEQDGEVTIRQPYTTLTIHIWKVDDEEDDEEEDDE